MNSVYQTKTMKKKGGNAMMRTIAILTLVAIAVSIAFGMAGSPAYAANSNVTVKQDGGYFATQGDKDVYVSFVVKNDSGVEITYYATLDAGKDITVVAGNGDSKKTSTLANGSATTLLFKIDIARFASVGGHSLAVTVLTDKEATLAQTTGNIDIGENLNPQVGNQSAAIDVAYTLSNSAGIVAGGDNTLSLEIFNRGNTVIKNAKISLGLPEGMSINNAAGSVNAGYISIGDTYKTKFPISAEETMVSKNYAVVVKVNGMDSSGGSVGLEQTLYIPVKGSGTVFNKNDVEITSISMPQQVMGGEEFTLSFDVSNRGSGKLADTKVSVEVPEGLANKTKNVFIISGLAAGKSQRCSVTMFSTNKADASKYQMVKITAAPATGDATASVSQYAGTMVKNIGGSEKTPQLMVSNYTYGGSYVQAGDEFSLNLGLYNTSASQDLKNIKVTVSSEDGTFIPVKSSNSFYIDRIATKKTATHGINLSTKRDAEQKTTSITVEMSYEDGAGNPFTSKDVISIPVMQETRLVVDDVTAPPELYPGMPSGVSVNFYNMGKTTLNNLRVNVAGDFDTPQSNLYYVGNMEKGKSDSYDFTFQPKQAGPMTGIITFTYEDAAGAEQSYEKAFEFTIMEEMPMEDPGAMEPPVAEKKIPWVPIGIGAAVGVGGIGVVLWKKHRKKKLEQEMEIDE